MAKVLTTNFIELTIPFGDKGYTCYTYNNDIYIIARNYGIYKYDFINKLFTLLYSTNLSYKEGFLYNDILYIKTSSSINSSYNPYITFSTYNITTGIYTSNVLTLTPNYKYSKPSSSYKNTVNLSTVNFYNNKLYVAGNGGRYYSSSNPYWITQLTFFIVYDLENNTYIKNNTTEYGTGSIGYVTTTIHDYFFSMYYFNAIGDNVYYKKFGQLNTNFTIIGDTPEDFYASTGFEYEGKIYLLGGQTRTKKITNFNKQTRVFEDMTLTLPQDTMYDAVTHVISGNNDVFVLFYPNGVFSLTFIDYNLNYKIANNSGDNVYVELTGQSPITKIRFNYDLGSEKVGYVMTTLSGDVTGSYTPNIPDGYKLIGFGYSPNASSSSVIGPLNTDISVSIDSDFTFYEVYGIYRPPGTSFDINLYQNTAEGNRVDKTNYLTQVGTISGALRSSTSINDLVITYESKSIPNFNYVYIPIFNRYYFVDDITSENYSLWTLALSVDPLMTYKEAILNCNGFVDRCESDFNANIIDKKRVIEEGNTIEVDTVTNELFTNTSGTYIMTALLVGFDSTEA